MTLADEDLSPVALIQHICMAIQRHPRGDYDTLLKRMQIDDPLLMPPDACISSRTEARLVQLACEVTQDIDFAMRNAVSLTIVSTLAEYVARHSVNLRQALIDARRFSSISHPCHDWTFTAEPESAVVSLELVDAGLNAYPRYLVDAYLSIRSWHISNASCTT